MSQVREILEAMRRGDWDLAVPRARSLPETSLPEITALLEGSQDPRDRGRCYALLSHVAVASRSPAIGTYVAQRVAVETQAKLIVQALEVVSWTQGIADYQPVLQALDHKNRDVQRWAIQALGACRGPEAEHRLLTTLREAPNPGTAYYAANALARICGPATIQALEAIFPQVPRKKPYESTLKCLIFAFARHPSPSCTEVVRTELEATQLWGAGWASLNYLFGAGDRGDEEHVSDYLRGVFKRLKRGTNVYLYRLLHIDAPFPTEATAGLATLKKYATDPMSHFSGEIRSLWDALTYPDHDWLLKTYPDEFEGLAPHPKP